MCSLRSERSWLDRPASGQAVALQSRPLRKSLDRPAKWQETNPRGACRFGQQSVPSTTAPPAAPWDVVRNGGRMVFCTGGNV